MAIKPRWAFASTFFGISILVAATAFGVSSAGQEPRQPTAQERAELIKRLVEAERNVVELRNKLAASDLVSGQTSDIRSYYESFTPLAMTLSDRPRLGLSVDTGSQDEASVLRVLAGGPAWQAGLRPGDVVTHVDGAALSGAESSPGAELIRRARDAEEGQALELRYQRDGETKEATVRPRMLGTARTEVFPRVPTVARAPRPPRPSAAPVLAVDTLNFASTGLTRWGRWSNMQLVPINEGLESYFGVREGLLVIEPPSDDEHLKLLAGDVVLQVGDREPRSATHLLRILSSYESGETVTLTVMRQRKRQTLEFELPKRLGGLFPSSVSGELMRVPAPKLAPSPAPSPLPRSRFFEQ